MKHIMRIQLSAVATDKLGFQVPCWKICREGPVSAKILEGTSLVKVFLFAIETEMCVLSMHLQDAPTAGMSSRSQSSTGGDGTAANSSKLIRKVEKSQRPATSHQQPDQDQPSAGSSSTRIACSLCPQEVLKKNLYAHLRNRHGLSMEECVSMRSKPVLECPLCSTTLADHHALANHCSAVHSEDGAEGRPQDYAIITRTFENQRQFEDWRDDMCKKFMTSFFCRSTSRQRLSLRCNRAGEVRETGGRERVAISRKGPRHCSAFMNINKNTDGSVKISACFGHVGHDLNPALLRLLPVEEEYVKNMIEEFTFDYILKKLRQLNSPEKSKLFYVNKQDLWNIVVKHRLRPGCRDDNDIISLKKRVEEHNNEDGIRLLNLPQNASGAGFMAVIINPLQEQWLSEYGHRGVALDDTFSITRYNLRLAALMVADKKDRGLPAAFLLSNTMSADEVKILFEQVKKAVPNFNPRIFLSDEALAFYNGFKAAFPESTTCLLFCRFHILQSWMRKAKDLVRAEFRESLAKALSELLRISEESSFRNRLTEVLSFLDQKGQTTFVEYLHRNYLGRIEEWAGFCRQGITFNTTMIAERWHGRLKTEYLHRNSNARADYLIDVLIKAPGEIAASFLIMDRRCLARPFRVRECNAGHRTALKDYENNKDRITYVAPGTWSVEAVTTNKTYAVTRSSSSHCDCDAKDNLHCRACGVCPYLLRRTCGSAARSGVSCEHMHAVMMYTDMSEETTEEPLHREVAQEASTTRELGLAEEPSRASSEEAEQLLLNEEPLSTNQTAAQPLNDKEKRMELWRTAKISITVIEDRVKRFAKMESDDTLEKLTVLVARIQEVEKLALSYEEDETRLVPRPEINRQGAKPHLTTIRLETRGEQKKRRAIQNKKQVEPIVVAPEMRNVCGLCLYKDPLLPADMNPEEFDARITEWLRCDNHLCKIWVHAACGRAIPHKLCTYCKDGHYKPCLA